MKITHHSRFAILTASIGAALLISACQPTNDKTTPATEEAAVVNDTDNVNDAAAATGPHASHDMSAGAMADAEHMTPMHQAYSDSMLKMHDEMMVGMEYNDPDAAFAKGMLGHHIGAVDMADIQLKYGTDKEMRQLAQEIIDAQQAEIEQMQTWLASHPDAPEATSDTKAMQQAYADGMDAMHDEMMVGIADPNADMAFARGMLPHHVGAVDMAKVQLKYGKDAEMRQLAQAVIDAQQSEIEQMQNWIAKQGS
ncbi:uncharacterized protein (DUF305 family) [Psychrobacter luti]|uniref:Uncharacterized protein (DUF305 family) n=1 Tax=Psychrobacter luti TaxID=198481 RepID=A0A839TE50_9GAMM|nr:DUF305 domain-containing protein [Psychrobacter luti]MBB3106315.1 uncharacterized protein (DUF305 family) [Psychrobacter luti]